MSYLKLLDARSKLIFIILLTLLVFIIDTLFAAVCLLLSFIIVRLAAGMPLKAKHLGGFAFLAVFVIILQTIFAPGVSYIVKFGTMVTLKWEGLYLGIMISCRFGALMLLLPVFSETTPAHRIAEGLCSLGLGYKIAFIITTAFNLIPFFKNEALVIMEAQVLRAGRLRGIKAYALLLTPLMLGAMKKAHISSVVMDSRSFGIYKTRTWYDKSVMKGRDYLFITFTVIYFAGMVFLNNLKELKIEPYLF